MSTDKPLVDALRFLGKALFLEGKPYQWNAKGPLAFDCSGLVTWCLLQAGGPDLRATHNCEVLWGALEPLAAISTGDIALAFYGSPGRVEHVMIAVPDGRAYGACGGNRDTLTLQDAVRDRACVQFRRTVTYRPGLLGFRSLRYRVEHA